MTSPGIDESMSDVFGSCQAESAQRRPQIQPTADR